MTESPLVNEHFNDFPIDFFKINREFFLDGSGGRTGIEANSLLKKQFLRYTKDIISPDENGRIYSSLREKINLDTKNTTVINASVGQGKTYSILRIVQEYFSQHPDTYIFIAVPFVSLVEQYFKELVELGIAEENIYRYEWLNPSHPNSTLEEQKTRRIHIVTVNCLLGNAGENAVLNSHIKRKYLQGFSRYLKGDEIIYNGRTITDEELTRIPQNTFDRNKLVINRGKNAKKSVFIYDEIHDAIHNFRKDNLFNLWHWQDSIHKNIIISATYNDAALVVIKYMSALTGEKIHIIESERKIIRENQSDLYLHFNSNHHYHNNDSILVRVISRAINKGDNIDILCFSRNLAEDIYKSEDGAGGLLKDAFTADGIKLCTSELISNQRMLRGAFQSPKYEATKCNIGTNFKTGVNIEKENHSFIIIFPPPSAKMPFENKFGIFSGGANDIIQALARQRIKGEIHIILPPCERMNYSTLPAMTDIQRDNFKRAFNSVSQPPITLGERALRNLNSSPNITRDEEVEYKTLNTQSHIIRDKFFQYVESIVYPIVSNSVSDKYKHYLEAPDLEEFRINNGSKVLKQDKFLCADLSSFITYCAFTNQFINCRLANFSFSRLYFSGEELARNIVNIVNSLFENEPAFSGDLYTAYHNVLDYIYNENEIYVDSHMITRANYNVKQQILTALLKKVGPEYFSETHPYKRILGDRFNHLNYLMYILQDIYENKRTSGDSSFPEPLQNLFNLREKFIETLYSNRNSHYLKPLSENDIFEELNINITDFLTSLKDEFPLLAESDTFRKILNKTPQNQKMDFYKYLAKTVGDFGKSRQYSFAQYPLRKLNSVLLEVPI